MLAIRTILHPTDFSESSDMAFHIACSLARDYGARLIVLHVAEPPVALVGDGVLLPPVPVDLKGLSDRLRCVVPNDSKTQVEHLLLEGSTPAEILRVADQTKCDVIVMGTHGRTGLNRLLMGSAAEEVVRKAPCPVLTAKPGTGGKRTVHAQAKAGSETKVPAPVE